jgi:hypothetical protein
MLAPLIAAGVLLYGCSDGKGAASAAAIAPNTASPAPSASATNSSAGTCPGAPASAGIYGEIAPGGGTLSGSNFSVNPNEPLQFVEVRYALEDPSPLPLPTPVPSAIPTPEPPLTITRYYGTYTIPAFAGVEAPESQSNPGAAYAATATTGCLNIVIVRGANGKESEPSVSGDLPSLGPGGLHRTVAVDMGPITAFTISNLTKNSGSGSFQFVSGSTVVNGTVTMDGSTTTTIR